MSEEVEEKPQFDPIEFGFDKDGYLRIKVHLSVGLWNMLGMLVEAQTRVMAQFGKMEKAVQEQKKGLVRPNGNLEAFKNRWH